MQKSMVRPPTVQQAIDPSSASTLVQVLQTNAASLGQRQAFRFIRGETDEPLELSYHGLHERAMAIGGELQRLIGPGERALLLFSPGLDFIAAFFGCLYAGVTAVPVALPARKRSASSVEAIVNASSPALVLTTADHCGLAKQSWAHLPTLLERPWIATDFISNDSQSLWRDPRVSADQPAFLQFTSGSTSSPKGVILSHENVLRNAALIHAAFGNTPESRGVFWLPQYHDMGLIGGVVQPIYCGGSCTLLAPAAFLQRPGVWLEAISKTKATVSGGPDFAYDLCVRKIPPADRKGLDLSSWNIAFTGAERVRADTIDRFVEAFAPCGFRREAFFPCYGLAEATLMVSGGPRHAAPAVTRVRADALGRNQVQDAAPDDSMALTLVASGECLSGQVLAIVDPQTREQCTADEVGEIWVQGKSVARGYYGRADATEAAFHGFLVPGGEGPFLRTGDLGFLRQGQLFVTGRLNDVIIIRGRNHYPEDIEHTVDSAYEAFRANSCVAFSIDVAHSERLVIVQELEPRRRDLDVDAAFRAIRRSVASEHELEVYAIVLTQAGKIPKTSSGKAQRSACRDRFLRGELTVVAEWRANSEISASQTWEADGGAGHRLVEAPEAERWLIRRIAERLGLQPAQVEVTTPFLEFGMGSVDAVEIAAELERWLGRRISPTVIYNYPNIAGLAQSLAQRDDHAFVPPPHAAAFETNPERLLADVRGMTNDDLEAFLREELASQQAIK